jgi:hypothetical protein
MGFVRALVAIILVTVAASPLLGGVGPSSDVPSVYASADAGQLVLRDKQERDREKKEQNRNSDEDEKGNRERTEDERRSDKDNEEENDDSPRVVTNAYAEDNYALEGHVTTLNCEIEPKQIGIRTLDGDAVLFHGPRNAQNRIDRLYCGDLVVGDYVFVHEAMKRDEAAYDVFYMSCQKDRDEGDDNTNDNDDDVDPNCTHIWSR